MEDFQLKLFSKISFDSLSEKEKEQLNDWCSNEEEFQSLKSLFTLVNDSKLAIGENFKTKNKLDELFEQKHQSANGFDWRSFLFPSGVLFFRKPAFQLAFGSVIIVGLTLFFFNRQEPVQIAKNESKKNEKSEIKKSEEANLTNEVQESPKVKEKFIQNEQMNVSVSDSDAILEQPIPIAISEESSFSFDGYTESMVSGTYALDDVVNNEDISNEVIRPVSETPSILDNLFTTY